MGVYSRHVLPRLVHFTCSAKTHTRQREKVVPLAKGRVLEVGIGTGLNLPFYDPAKVSRLWGLDPSKEMLAIARRRRGDRDIDVEYLEGFADDIPLDDDSADTVLVTYTLCSVSDVAGVLEEIRRVLRPDGELIFCEHGEAPDDRVRRWQKRLNPVWRRLGGGCNLNRPVPRLLEQGGFEIRTMDAMYLPGWKPASFNYRGTAVGHRP